MVWESLYWQVSCHNQSGLSCVCKASYTMCLWWLSWPLRHSHTPFVIFPEEETCVNHLLSILERLDCGIWQSRAGAAGIDHIRVVSVFHTAAALSVIYRSSAVLWHFHGLPGTITNAEHQNPPFVLLTSAVQAPIPLNSKVTFQSGWLN